METKSKSEKLKKLRKRLGFKEGMYVELEGLNGGLSLCWKNGMGVKVMIGNKNLIDTVVSLLGSSMVVRVFWIYGASIFEERKVVWEHIKRKARNRDGPLMCLRDFNDVVSNMEKEWGRRKRRRKMEGF